MGQILVKHVAKKAFLNVETCFEFFSCDQWVSWVKAKRKKKPFKKMKYHILFKWSIF
jgi:hypothetical protein